MRVPGSIIFLAILTAGALVLCPVIAFLGIDPLPGDLHLNLNNHKVFLPVTQSLIASATLGLLFLWAKK
ncbi:MAG TPA: DUF2905 family protein [Rhizomicrobium sp.]|nr:DUF2905 family protein [Rhizomicrobium sp.]